VLRLRQAQEEAEKTIRELKEQHKKEFEKELAQKDQGDAGFANELKKKIEEEKKAIDAGYEADKGEVMDLLLRHVTTVQLEVSEALRQSLITKNETGTQ
jgi:vacuolar-type H+-ATPase subunit H